VAYEYANFLLDGQAKLKADSLGAELKALVVMDRSRESQPRQIQTMLKHWEAQGRDVEVIDLAELRQEPIEVRTNPVKPVPSEGFPEQIMAMLFADAVGYSKLTDREIPTFVNDFLGAIADLVESLPYKPVLKNTWGDAIYFVFSSVSDAGNFGLALSEILHDTDWAAKGLPENLTLRIGLHAGPVFSCIDPIIDLQNYTGAHVSRAARIEPITPPGLVYSSQHFAAMAAAQGVEGFVCEYVGVVALAKKYGDFPVYHVRRPSSL